MSNDLEMLKKLNDLMLSLPAIYSDYKGNCFLVEKVAVGEQGAQIVVYSFDEGRSKVIPASSFFVPSPVDVDKPFYHRIVVGKKRQIGDISTRDLVEELLRREDNPYSSVPLQDYNDKIFREDFMVVKYTQDNIDGEMHDDFEVETVHNTLQEAKSRLNKVGYKYSILKSVLVKMDFDEN